MQRIIFKYGALRVETFGKIGAPTPEILKPNPAGFGPLSFEIADEVPVIYYQEGVALGGFVSSKDDTVKELALKKIKEAITSTGLDVHKAIAYIGPCLTFSHVPVLRDFSLSIMEKGYQAAIKRTDKIDYFDIPLMNALMLRKAGFLMENIFITDYDTYENSELLFSYARGDKKENTLVAYLEK